MRKITIRKFRRDGVRQRYHVGAKGVVKKLRVKKKLRLIVGGPPHSGKSTFMTLLYRDLRDKNVDAFLIDLDYASPTIKWLMGGTRGAKQPWTTSLARKAHNDFLNESRKHDITLGDTPGKITSETYIIARGADAAIIVSRDPIEVRKWRRAFKAVNVPLIATVDSRLTGFNIYSHKRNRGRATKLSRDDLRAGRIDDENIVIESVSHEISEILGLDLRNELKNNRHWK